MKVITVAHPKGDRSQTPLSLSLAYCFAESLQVGILDTDKRGSIIGLQALLNGIKLVDIMDVVTGQATDCDLVLIDTPPYLSKDISGLFDLSDYVLIQTKAGVLDAMAIVATVELLKRSVEKRPNLKAGIVLNMVLSQSNMNDEVRAMLAAHDLPIHETMISHRVSYARSSLTNDVFGSSDQKAKAEVAGLAAEIIKAL